MIALRSATVADAALLAALHAEAAPDGETWTPAAIAAQLGLPGTFGSIAVADAAAGGLVLARVAADEAEILTIAVLPGQRRRGLGGALMRSAMATAAGRGARAMFLEVAEDNPAATALYDALGFVRCGRRPGYYRGGGGALVMRACLPCESTAG